MLAAQVKCPVRLEVPVVDDGAEPEDGLGALDAPPGAGDIEAVADDSLNFRMIMGLTGIGGSPIAGPPSPTHLHRVHRTKPAQWSASGTDITRIEPSVTPRNSA